MTALPHSPERDGLARRAEDRCDAHSEDITSLKTTLANGRWVTGVIVSIATLVFAFVGWVANDNLAGIRGDLKEAKGMLMTIQRDSDKVKIEVDYLNRWKVEVDEHMKLGMRPTK